FLGADAFEEDQRSAADGGRAIDASIAMHQYPPALTQPIGHPGRLRHQFTYLHAGAHLALVAEAVLRMMIAIHYPGVRDATEVEYMIYIWALRPLVMKAADKEAVALGATVQVEGDGVASVAAVEHGAVGHETHRLRRHWGPAAYDWRPPSRARALFQ